MFNRDVDEEIGRLNPRLGVAAERGRREQQLQMFLAAALDPHERSVFALHYCDALHHYCDEVPLHMMAGLLGLQSVADEDKLHVGAGRMVAEPTIRLGVRGEYS